MGVEGPSRGDDVPAAPRMILVVDDDDLLRQMLVRLFLKHGWATSECGDGAVALELIEKTAFDLVLLDKNLPGLGGVEVLQRLRARGDDVPVAMMTGFGSVESAIETMELGVEAYFMKPFESIRDLVDRATEIVDRRRRRTSLRRGRPPMAPRFVIASPNGETAEWLASRIDGPPGTVRCVADLSVLFREAHEELSDVALVDAAYGLEALTEAIECIRALPRAARVVVVGPAPTLEDAAALATAGAGGFLRGPHGHASEFASALARLLRGRAPHS